MNNRSMYKWKCSRFIKWVFGIIVVSMACISIYIVCDVLGLIQTCKDLLKALNDASVQQPSEILKTNRILNIITIACILLTVVVYVGISLFNLSSHRAIEDCRMYCLPVISTPVFIIIENALLHLFVSEQGHYYIVTVGVMSTIALTVVTFASLKFSFAMSNQRSRFSETSRIKPEIVLHKNKSGKFIVNISKNECFLSGIFIGKIDKFEYRDIKRTGFWIYLDKLIFPNRKFLYKTGKTGIDFSQITNKSIDELCTYADIGNSEIYLIFRDMQNYYYFAQLPYKNPLYNVVGINECVMTRLFHIYNKRQNKKAIKEAKGKIYNHKTIKYEVMDWFDIPYNFFPDKI